MPTIWRSGRKYYALILHLAPSAVDATSRWKIVKIVTATLFQPAEAVCMPRGLSVALEAAEIEV
jgi:hypothetical protein